MAKSLPSKRVAVVNAPEIGKFYATFDYNFFVPDERVNDTGKIAPAFITRRPSEAFDASFIESRNFQVKVPRACRLEWVPVIGPREYVAVRTSITDNYGKIHNEQNFTPDDYSNIVLQDTGADQRLSFFVRRAMEEVQKGFSASGGSESPLDIAKELNALTPEEIRGSFLASILVNLKDLGVTFITKQNREAIATSLTKQIQETKNRLQLNNRVLTRILASATESPTGLFEDEAAALLGEAEQREAAAIGSYNSSVLSEGEYDMEIVEYIGVRNIDSPASFDSTVQPVGYIIDKQEILPNGTVVDMAPIIVENPLASTTADLKIKYGSKYSYSIRSVVFVEVQAQDIETGNVIAISFLVCSQSSAARVVECVERAAPPPPADFNIAWDYKKTAARITWAMPTNPQRDIKYFQLFRRKTIMEPFELIKQFDFDDSVIRTAWNESPDPVLIEKLASPRNYFIDEEFGRDSKFIYALCSVDAHGFSSNYSMQLEVSFDRFKNRINKKLISVAGAPKAYPNMYLNQDTFVDTIRDSGHSQVQVIFNPEYLEVFNGEGDDLRVLKTGSDAFYKLSLINVDLQSQKTVTIHLEDKRTSEEQNEEGIGEVS
jgi:hypothetical protein